jgi:PncC family amidohydrolase
MEVTINLFGNFKQMIQKYLKERKFSLDKVSVTIKEKCYETYVTLNSASEDSSDFEFLKDSIMQDFKKNVYGTNERNIYTSAFRILKEQHKTLALAESATAGRLSSEFVSNNEGASGVLVEGIVCYSIFSKCSRFGIDSNFFETNSPQSAECSKLLACSLAKQDNTDVTIAVTGYASSISEDKENGDAYIAIALRTGVYTQRVHFSGTRNHIIQQFSKCAFMFMIKILNQ